MDGGAACMHARIHKIKHSTHHHHHPPTTPQNPPTNQQEEADFPGVYLSPSATEAAPAQGGLRSGLLCPNPACQALYWGAPNAASCFARLFNKVRG